MNELSGSLVPIRLELEAGVPILESNELVSLLSEQTTSRLAEFLTIMGIDESPVTEVQPSREDDRVMQVFVRGVRQPYSPETMRRAWRSRAPDSLRDLPDRETVSFAFPDRWLHNFVLGVDLKDTESINLLSACLSAIAVAAVLEDPACLLSQNQVLRYVGKADVSGPIHADYASDVLSSLLDHGISIADRPNIAGSIEQGYRLGRSGEDTSELLFARLKSTRLEIIVSSDDLRDLVGVSGHDEIISVYSEAASSESRDLMKSLEETLFWELGIYLPDMVWSIAQGTPRGMIAFKTNDQVSAYLPLLSKDQLLVNAPPDRLKQLNEIPATPMPNPANGNPCSVVSNGYRAILEGESLTTWTSLGYVVLLLGQQIRQRATHLFTINDAAYHLARFNRQSPVLVKSALKRFSIVSITRILRALLSERIPIRDLRSILERLLHYDTIPVDASKVILFDERLPVSPSSKVLYPESWRSYYEFLRAGLKRQITSVLLQGRSTIPVYLIDVELEQWLTTQNMTDHDDKQEQDAKRQAVRQAVWSVAGADSGSNPVILTSVEPRVALREIIGREMPHFFVVAYSELTPDVTIQPIDRILLPMK